MSASEYQGHWRQKAAAHMPPQLQREGSAPQHFAVELQERW